MRALSPWLPQRPVRLWETNDLRGIAVCVTAKEKRPEGAAGGREAARERSPQARQPPVTARQAQQEWGPRSLQPASNGIRLPLPGSSVFLHLPLLALARPASNWPSSQSAPWLSVSRSPLMGVLSQERALLGPVGSGWSQREGRGEGGKGWAGWLGAGKCRNKQVSPEKGEDRRRRESARRSSMVRQGQSRYRTHATSATRGQCPRRQPAACCPHSEPVRKNGQAAPPAQCWPPSTTQHSPADANTSSTLPFLWGALWCPSYTWARGSTEWRTGSVLLSGCLYLQHAHAHAHRQPASSSAWCITRLMQTCGGTSSLTHSEVTPALALCSWPATWTPEWR